MTDPSGPGTDGTAGAGRAALGAGETADGGPRAELRRAAVVLDREFAAVVTAPALWLLSAGYVATTLALAFTGGVSGSLSLVLDLLTPTELLVPVLAVGFGYRAVRGDAARAELDVLRTYPLSRRSYVLGTYLARLAALLVVVLVPLAVGGVGAALVDHPASKFLATHAAGETPLLVVRFAVLTAVYAAVVLAVVVALSTLAAATRSALALGAGAVVLVGVGIDLLVVGLVTGGTVGPGAMPWLVAVSPASAFRGLVLTSIGAGSATAARVTVPALNVAGLSLWLVAALAVAVRTVWD